MARNRFDIDESLETPFSFTHLKRALIYVKKHKTKMISALFLSISSVACALFAPQILAYAIDNTIPNKDYKQLWLLTALLALSITVSIILTLIRSRLMAVVGQSIVYEIRKDLFEHLQKLPFQYYDDRPHGKILVRVVNYVNSVSDMLSNGLINFILEIFNIFFIVIFMLFTDIKLTFVVISGVPIFVLFVIMIKPRQRRTWQKVSNKNSNLNAYLQESIDGVKITQGFTREEENAKIFEKLNDEAYKAQMAAIKISQTVPVLVDNITVILVSLMYLVGVAWTLPYVTVGVLLAMGGYAWRFWQPILSLSNIYNQFINTIAYLERIFQTIDEPLIVSDVKNAKTLPEISGNVEFKDVTFSYDGQINILENFNVKISAGESIALVGPTGAGKTTVVNLLSRFYNINSGAILIDGNDISQVTLKSLRSQMGIMLQDSFVFAGTIMENIRYGKLDATEEEVRKACETVRAAAFIEALPHGYETVVSERGGGLSSGQKQLISFARTLLSNPKILILDEATSSIDAKTEKDLQIGLNNLLKGRTSFVIAHRLSTIKNSDRILYIADKGIKECGSHDELIAKNGFYHSLYTAQLD